VNFTVADLDLRTTHPFVIARGGGSAHANLVLSLADGEVSGSGEGSPTHYYGETRVIARAALAALSRSLPDLDGATLDAPAIGAFMAAADHCLAYNPAAKAALDGALWDLLGKRLGEPVWRLLGLEGGPETARVSSFTIALAEPEQMIARAREAVAAGFNVLKLKASGDGDVAVVERIAAETGAVLRVDANGSWRAEDTPERCERLALAGVEFVEQPLEWNDLAGYRRIAGRCALPVVLDESVRSPLDVEVFGEYVDGVNLKIAKHGGLLRSLEVARAAKAGGLDLMIGCMIESSLGIAQAAQLLPLVRWADLDGALLLDEDPYAGLAWAGNSLSLPAGPGLGVARR
jgi:L-alanine-DL-glutamate epimerase-like enolase superfamily enzyme